MSDNKKKIHLIIQADFLKPHYYNLSPKKPENNSIVYPILTEVIERDPITVLSLKKVTSSSGFFSESAYNRGK
jgi:hypothetical protein